MRTAFVALALAACGGQSTHDELAPLECTRHAQYAAPAYDVYLVAAGFDTTGCAYAGPVAIGYLGSHRDDAGQLGDAQIAFDEDGAVLSCAGACDALADATPVRASCGGEAVDVNRDPLPAGSCGIVRFE